MQNTDLKTFQIKDYFMVSLKGILLGLISVGIPGFSASTIGIIIGIYFLMVESIANIFKDPKHNIPFLIFLMIGYGIGAIGASASVSILYDYFPLITTFAILGFLFGSMPEMFNDLKPYFSKISCWITLIVVVALLITYNFTVTTGATIEFPQDPSIGFLCIMCAIGLITSATFIVPGVDFAVVFLSLGIYYPFTNMLLNLVSFGSEDYVVNLLSSLKILGCYLIGYFVGIFLFSKLIKTLSKKYTAQTQFASLGFVIASPIIVIKSCIIDNSSFVIENVPTYQWVIGIICFVLLLIITVVVNNKTHQNPFKEKKD